VPPGAGKISVNTGDPEAYPYMKSKAPASIEICIAFFSEAAIGY